MTKGFTFEKNLPHQQVGVQAVLEVFNDAQIEQVDRHSLANPDLTLPVEIYTRNIHAVQNRNEIEIDKKYYDADSSVLDISMETGTGKTYTYTQTMFELNKAYGVTKFMIVVPTLSIKAGTVNFLKSEAMKEHFRDEYDREVKLHLVESQRGRSNKSYMPQAIQEFVQANNFNRKYIHVLVINSGMVNSPSLSERYDVSLFNEQYDVPFEAIAAVKPIMIIDEPHRFPTEKKTWSNIEKFKAQYIIRYGATFKEYKNLLYRLTAVDSFNNNLVKGIQTHISEVVGVDAARLTFVDSTGKEATFELLENNERTKYKLTKGESLSKIHSAIYGLEIEHLNMSAVLLSNGVELKKKDAISPYSYSQTVQDDMIRSAIKGHFDLERELLTRETRIKPLTLFFIDDIAGYRAGEGITGTLKDNFEQWVVAEAKKRLKTESDPFYRQYLEQTLQDVSRVHGGYFSKDNTDKDDKIELEINEILHDKESLLSLNNPRRFIFSKWTLREGWDNPNVFQICKLRSSGSTISKLQEVGRGLRLPVNEYMSRVKDEQFYLNYYVDLTEKNFTEQLVQEVNESSYKEVIPTKLTPELIEQITAVYDGLTALDLRVNLNGENVIDGNDAFVSSDSYAKIKELYSAAFTQTVAKNKIINANDKPRQQVTLRKGKYHKLKELWELICQKVILEYKIKDEDEFLELLLEYLKSEVNNLTVSGIRTRTEKVVIEQGKARLIENVQVEDNSFLQYSTMSYPAFIARLAQDALIKQSTLHQAFVKLQEQLDITSYLNMRTVKTLVAGFKRFLLMRSFQSFSIGYNKVSNRVHPTKLTNDKGSPLDAVDANDIGQFNDPDTLPLSTYFFDEVFYDSDLEHQNITKENIENVVVFTKIPKNSIKIPIAGGFTYSPDFAYVVKTTTGQILNFVIETKNVLGDDDLRKEERQKIQHAKALFSSINKEVAVEFKTQFSKDKIVDLLRESLVT